MPIIKSIKYILFSLGKSIGIFLSQNGIKRVGLTLSCNKLSFQKERHMLKIKGMSI